MKQIHPLTEAFLNAVTAKIKQRKLREEIYLELLSHIDDALEMDLTRGLSEEESLRKTLAAFGDPDVLSKKLKLANKPWYWRWTYLLPSLAVFVFVVCGIGSSIYAAKRYEMIKGAFNEKKNLRAEIVKTFNEMKNLDPLFTQTFTTGRDAGEFLNSRIAWFGEKLRNEYPLSLPENLFVRVERHTDGSVRITHLNDEDWETLDSLRKINNIDLSWFEKIHSYDYWELSSFESPAGQYMLTDQTLSASPFPHFPDLNTYVKLRLAQGIVTKKLLPALKDARKMTELLYSTETLIGTLTAVSMLSYIDRAAKDGLAKGLIRKEDWKLANYDRTKIRLTAYAVAHWTDFFSSNEFKEELFAGQPVFGGCGAISETSYGLSNLKSFDYFNHPFWGERSFANDLKAYQAFARQQSQFCRMKTTKHLWATQFKEEISKDLFWRVGIQIPYIRQYFFFSLMSYAAPNWLGAYENYSNEKEPVASTGS